MPSLKNKILDLLSRMGVIAHAKIDLDTFKNFESEMDNYYKVNSNYHAFIAPAYYPLWYDLIHDFMPSSAVVLEVGAGRSCFGDYLKDKSIDAIYHSQDITDINHQWLAEHSEKFWNCPLKDVHGSYDVIFSTYVYEHVVNPQEFLEEADRLLKDGGVHIVIGPNYDVPGYLCPSLRSNSFWTRLKTIILLISLRITQRFSSVSHFLINTAPACLTLKWYRDADACHIVSKMDLVNWCKANNYTVEDLHYPGANLRDKIFKKILVLQVACRKKQ